MFKRLYLLFLILNASVLFAQQIKDSNSICFFQDGKTGKPITIVNDTLVYKGDLKNPMPLKHTDYPETLEQYSYHFTINKHTYLVHDGCGVVLEFRNDSIVRIDNSFLHRNQHFASPFVYNNQIHLFGGYGLFTFKNIITKYDFDTKEWNEINIKSEEAPHPKKNADRILIGDDLYVFGGGYYIYNTTPISIFKDKTLWHFNLKTTKWKELGAIKAVPKEFDAVASSFQAHNKLYDIKGELIYEIDVQNNSLKYYKNNSRINPYSLFYDAKTDAIFVLHSNPATNELNLKTIKLSNLLNGKPFKTETFYSDSEYVVFWDSYKIYLGLGVLLVLIPIGFRKIYQKRKLDYIVYDQNKNQVYDKFNVNLNLDVLEENFLIHLIKNNATYIQLNDLNPYFEYENQENFNLIIKKRDAILSGLYFKLQSILHVDQEALVLQQKNKIDKRIKEIRLNPQFFKIK